MNETPAGKHSNFTEQSEKMDLNSLILYDGREEFISSFVLAMGKSRPRGCYATVYYHKNAFKS